MDPTTNLDVNGSAKISSNLEVGGKLTANNNVEIFSFGVAEEKQINDVVYSCKLLANAC